MKKFTFIVCTTLFIVHFASAQAYEGTVEFKKKKNAAFIIEYPYPEEAVENAIDARMKKNGNKGKEERGLFNGDKGFKTFSHVFLTDVSDDAMDYIVKVERKSRKDDDKSVLYLILMKDDVNQLSLLDADANSKAKSFLNNFNPDIEAAWLDIKIKDQEEVVAKAEKKCKKLLDDQVDMEAKIKKLKENLEENSKDQQDTAKSIEEGKLALDALKASKKP